MSKKAVITGQLNLVDETTNVNFVSFDLAAKFGTLTGIGEITSVERDLVDTDTVVSVGLGGVVTLTGFALFVTGGEVLLKHDSNTAGITITSGFIFFGNIASITIETAATSAIKVEYIFWE